LTHAEGAGLREVKQVLAREVTALAHGEEAASTAEAATRALFRGAPDVEDPNIPTTVIATTEVEGMSLADVFVRAGLVASRGEARRKAAEGALWIDGERVESVDALFQPAGSDALLRFGKKRYRRIHIAP
jgi:tyrosyl-tRNA synthetase